MKDYPKDTLGYHYVRAEAIFGKDSESLKYLDEKIKESPLGKEEKVVAPEEQMLHLLGNIHFGVK